MIPQRCVSDELLAQFEQLDLPENDPSRPVSDHFDAYSDLDLLIASGCSVNTHNSNWMRHVVHWDGAAGSWTLNVPPPCVSEQLAVCLEVLNFHLELVDVMYGAGALAAAQRRLSQILVDHPVLLHPYLRIHVSLATTKGTCSLPHAIALSRNARFPMQRDGLTKAELAAFVNHPCVRMGLTFRQPGHRGALRDAEGATALGAGMNRSMGNAGLLVSMHGLDELFDTVSRGSRHWGANPVLRPFRGAPGRMGSEVPVVYAASMLNALGLYLGPQPGTAPTRGVTYPELVKIIAEEDHLLRREITHRLQLLVTPTIFSDAPAPIPPQHVHDSVHRIAAGLVAADFEETPECGARWVREALRVHGFPPASVGQALAYVRALAELGVHGCEEFFKAAAAEAPLKAAHVQPWLSAARIHASETGMQAVIEEARATPTHVLAPAPRARRCV